MSLVAFPSSGVASFPMGVGSLHRPLVWVHGKPITLGRFLAQVRGLAAQLPSGRYVVNLCEDRYRFCWRSMRVHYVARFLFAVFTCSGSGC